jgi:hypothetical protein
MAAKTQIVDFLGDKALVLPALLDAAIVANDRAKYVLSLLQLAASYMQSIRKKEAHRLCGASARPAVSPMPASIAA